MQFLRHCKSAHAHTHTHTRRSRHILPTIPPPHPHHLVTSIRDTKPTPAEESIGSAEGNHTTPAAHDTARYFLSTRHISLSPPATRHASTFSNQKPVQPVWSLSPSPSPSPSPLPAPYPPRASTQRRSTPPRYVDRYSMRWFMVTGPAERVITAALKGMRGNIR